MDQKIIAEIVGYMAAFIGAGMFMPQAFQVWKTKNTKSISLISFSLFALNSILWLTYGVLLKAAPVILVNFILFFLNSFIVYMKLKYK